MSLCRQKTKKGTLCKNFCGSKKYCRFHLKTKRGGGEQEQFKPYYDDYIRNLKNYYLKMANIEKQGRKYLISAQNSIPIPVRKPKGITTEFQSKS